MKLGKLVFIALIFVQIGFAKAEGLTAEQAQKFMHVSGLTETMNSMPDHVQQQMNLKGLMAEDKNLHDKISSALGQAIADIDAQSIALSYLQSSSDAGSLRKATEFLDSDIGRAIIAAEHEMNSPEAQVIIQQYALEIAKNPPAEKRVELIQDLVASLHLEETMVNMIKGMMFSTVDILKELKPEAGTIAESAMNSEWKMMEPMLSSQFAQYAIVASHYAYRNINDENLARYIEFLKSDEGQIYWKVGMNIFNLYLKEFLRNTITIATEQA